MIVVATMTFLGEYMYIDFLQCVNTLVRQMKYTMSCNSTIVIAEVILIHEHNILYRLELTSLLMFIN